MSDTYADAVRIAKSIERAILRHGGTSGHVAAASVELPAFMFDALLADAEIARGLRPGAASTSMRLYGVQFIRGRTNKAIRDSE
jgi:hypothetical protein